MALGPAPLQDLKQLPVSYQLWFNQLKQFVGGTAGSIPWAAVSKDGSSIADLATRDHNLLTTIQGGQATEYYHLNLRQHNGLTALTTISSTTTLGSSHGYVLCNAAGGAITVNLPAATTRYRFSIKRINSGTNDVTIDAAGSDTIEGAGTVVLSAQYQSRTIYSDGSGVWYIEAST